MLSDKFIRITLPRPLIVSEQNLLGLLVNNHIKENLYTELQEGVGDIFTGTIFETELGHSIEFALNQDLDDTSADSIVEEVFKYFKDCDVEVSGDK